ncbi:MAG: Trk family potassium uptake protein, partial [Chloroflexi bacterium]|nr:Trk family potassium uptake protein [Chloroflexota bacterium]
ITFLSFLWINVVALLLSLFEEADFIGLMFEVVSAFALVGLSTGLTADLTAVSKVVLILSMFVGRLAPFLLALELAQRERRSPYRFAHEEVRIG